jgi:hypothetical protein
MSNLANVIEKAADDFARLIVDAVKSATPQEIISMSEATVAIPERKRGRPANPDTATPAKKRRKIKFPKCSVPGCGKNRWARGNGMCGEHFKASKMR